MKIAPVFQNNYNTPFQAKLKTMGNDDRLSKEAIAAGRQWATQIGSPDDTIEVNFVKPNVFEYEMFRQPRRMSSLARENFYEPSVITVRADFDGETVKEVYHGFDEDEGLFFALNDMAVTHKAMIQSRAD